MLRAARDNFFAGTPLPPGFPDLFQIKELDPISLGTVENTGVMLGFFEFVAGKGLRHIFEMAVIGSPYTTRVFA